MKTISGIIISLKQNIAERICAFLLISVLFFLSFFIVYRADWVISDDFETLQTTAIGRAEPLSRHIGQEMVANGRFYPLGHYDMNILSLIPGGAGPVAHYSYNLLQFLLLMFMLWLISGVSGTGKTTITLRTAAFLIFAGLPGVFWVFSGINYPERFLMLLFAAFILCFRQAVKTQKTLFFVLCGIMAAYSTYMKEPVFGIFCVFAVSSLIFSPKMSEKEKKFYFFLLFNGFLFLVLYYIFAYRTHSSLYTSAFSSGFFSFAASFFRGEKLNAAVLLFSAYRFYAVAAKKERNSVFEDSLLFAASGYICSYIILGFTFAYYYAPSVLLAVPSAVREISLIGRIGGYEKYCRQAFAALFLVLAAANIPLEASNIAISYVERTTHMPFIRTLAAHQKSGGTLYWNLPGNLPLNSINPTVNGQRHIYNVFLDYVNKKYSAEKLPGQNENFVLFRNASEINIKNDDILFMPLFIGKNGQPLPFSEEILEAARKKGFAPLKCDLIYVRIFMKKGSYLEPNWLLSV